MQLIPLRRLYMLGRQLRNKSEKERKKHENQHIHIHESGCKPHRKIASWSGKIAMKKELYQNILFCWIISLARWVCCKFWIIACLFFFGAPVTKLILQCSTARIATKKKVIFFWKYAKRQQHQQQFFSYMCCTLHRKLKQTKKRRKTGKRRR